jgi:hypothetical protein
MYKIISAIILALLSISFIVLAAMSVTVFLVNDWSRWTEPMFLLNIAFGLLLGACAWWILCILPHFFFPIHIPISMPATIKKWLEENNKVPCPHIHLGYETVPLTPPQVAESSTMKKTATTNPKKVGTDSIPCREVNLDEAVKVYGESMSLAILLGSSAIVLGRTLARCRGNIVSLETTMYFTRMPGKICVEVLQDFIVPETGNYTEGVDFRQVDRFNIKI